MAKGPQVGDTFPDFSLTDQHGASVSLEQLLGQKLVIYFYPRDDTPGCTAQACGFRDQLEDFSAAGAKVIGISDDSPAKHAAFAERHRLPFTLLSDRGGAFRKAIKVPSTLGLLPGRVTYIVDKQGHVRHRFSSQSQATKHVSVSLRILKEMA